MFAWRISANASMFLTFAITACGISNAADDASIEVLRTRDEVRFGLIGAKGASPAPTFGRGPATASVPVRFAEDRLEPASLPPHWQQQAARRDAKPANACSPGRWVCDPVQRSSVSAHQGIFVADGRWGSLCGLEGKSRTSTDILE